jgi:hypothetical protein
MYILREIIDKVWLAEFDNSYEMAMTFLRYQEFYESPNSLFFRKPFLIKEYVKWYSDGGEFTYHNDWTGFNIPSEMIFECQKNIPDYNKWDDLMSEIVNEIKNKNIDRFYLIGTKNGDSGVLDHEIAHGLFYTNKDYKNEMLDLYNNMCSKAKENIHNYLRESGGYSEEVFIDETQAYLSTGFYYMKSVNKEAKKFRQVYDKYKMAIS